MSYDESYTKAPALFGAAPEEILTRHWQGLNAALPVLDLGAGQGRHTLWLARQGIRVHALDPSRVAVETVRKQVESEALPVVPLLGTFESHGDDAAPYGGILIFGLIQILTWDGIRELQRRVARWTAPGSLLFITAFSSRDDGCSRLARTQEPIGPHSYLSADGEPRTYLAPDGVLTLFEGFDPVHHWEGLGAEHRHGDGAPERHFMVEAVLKRFNP